MLEPKDNPEYQPGTIVCSNVYEFSKPYWGIVLPKEAFVTAFEEEKGAWPAGRKIQGKGVKGRKITERFLNKYGYFMPCYDDDNVIFSCVTGGTPTVVADPKEFIEDARFVGIKFPSDTYNTTLGRTMGLEVISAYPPPLVSATNPEELLTLIKHRKAFTQEVGGVHYESQRASSWLDTLYAFFTGQLKGQPTLPEAEAVAKGYDNQRVKFIQLLRACDFDEGQGIEGIVNIELE
ncbi:hypothetical protein GOV04_01410 [Candidatus Woesearchaeota archaeon]|nr:hypothetical protein [Candidatus Woesearchaeota archaeon]